MSLPCVASSAPALDLAGLSSEVDACTDFDDHVNGRWLASTSMPVDKARVDTFDDLRDESRRIVEQALVDAGGRQPLDTRSTAWC